MQFLVGQITYQMSIDFTRATIHITQFGVASVATDGEGKLVYRAAGPQGRYSYTLYATWDEALSEARLQIVDHIAKLRAALITLTEAHAKELFGDNPDV